MSEPNKFVDSEVLRMVGHPTPSPGFTANSTPTLNNASVSGHPHLPYRATASTSTPVAPTPVAPPPVPPRIEMTGQMQQPMMPVNSYGGMGGYGMGGYGMGGYGMGGYGMGMGMGMGGMYGGYNRYGVGGPMYPGDIESRFVQIAEESSRPAFDSIQNLVNAVGSVAMMMESTFFAITSSFRAILGVAENVGRLRSLFAQFWSTLAVVRYLNWILRKLLVYMGIRTETEFKAWAEAVASTQTSENKNQPPRTSSWPVLMFFGILTAAPYIVLKMMSRFTRNINEDLNDPKTWQEPIRAIAQFPYTATLPQELSFRENQLITVAPQQLQPHLWNSGWLMATTDNKTPGLIPINYVKLIKPSNQDQEKQLQAFEESNAEQFI